MTPQENKEILDRLIPKYNELLDELKKLPYSHEIRYAMAHLEDSIQNVKKSLDDRTFEKARKITP